MDYAGYGLSERKKVRGTEGVDFASRAFEGDGEFYASKGEVRKSTGVDKW